MMKMLLTVLLFAAYVQGNIIASALISNSKYVLESRIPHLLLASYTSSQVLDKHMYFARNM
jgi:hypothetical protein